MTFMSNIEWLSRMLKNEQRILSQAVKTDAWIAWVHPPEPLATLSCVLLKKMLVSGI